MEILNQQVMLNRNGLFHENGNHREPDIEMDYEDDEDSDGDDNNAPIKKAEKAKWSSDEVSMEGIALIVCLISNSNLLRTKSCAKLL